MGEIVKLNTVKDYNDFLGVETLHPLVSVVDMSQLAEISHGLKNFGFYCIYLKQLECGTLLYGRNRYDYEAGTLVFIAPGQVAGVDDDGVSLHPQGWILMFHPDLLRGTSLARQIADYSFFSYESNEALHVSEEERTIVRNLLVSIRDELKQPADRHSRKIVIANIEVLLNHCLRFYDRQFDNRKVLNRDILTRFEGLLRSYFTEETRQQGLPSVAWCANQLNLSPNYFGDLIKKETGISAQEHIQNVIIEKAKEMLVAHDKSVSEVAYALGFKYPHHLSRLFKKYTGESPKEYRTRR